MFAFAVDNLAVEALPSPALRFCYSILALSLLGRKARLFPTLLEHVVLGLNWTLKALPLLRRHASPAESPASDSGASASPPTSSALSGSGAKNLARDRQDDL